MFKSIILIAAFAAVNAGIIGTHTVVEPVLANVGAVVHSYPSAVSHQSYTRIHNKAVVADVVAPVVNTVEVAPVVKAAEPAVKAVEVESPTSVEPVAPVEEVAAIKSVEAADTVEVTAAEKPVEVAAVAPVVNSLPIVQTYAAAPVLSHVYHAAPVVGTYSSPLLVAHTAPVVYSSPIVKTIASPLIYTIQH